MTQQQSHLNTNLNAVLDADAYVLHNICHPSGRGGQKESSDYGCYLLFCQNFNNDNIYFFI